MILYWYLLLSIISIVIILYTLRTHKDGRIIVLFFAISGIIYPFELIVLIYTEAYTYELGIFNNIYKDSVVGNFVSNLLAVPAASLWIAVNHIKKRWYFPIAFLFVVIELTFVNLGIFERNWWKTYYTFLLLPIHFYLSTLAWNKLNTYSNKQVSAIVKWLLLYFACVSSQGFLTFTTLGAYETINYQINLYENSFRNHLSLSVPLLFLYSLAISFGIVKRVKKRLVLCTILLFNAMLMLLHLLYFTHPVYFAVFHLEILIILYLIEHFRHRLQT
ncbi:hypothetical protein ACFFGV_12780 [Pontibacillus salicampi]|uniref:Uncharacterized protein n=1 Tax=Pontibacillus salicampi TaxID=1449801 RepID=A0ABV6LPW3_9BACI